MGSDVDLQPSSSGYFSQKSASFVGPLPVATLTMTDSSKKYGEMKTKKMS